MAEEISWSSKSSTAQPNPETSAPLHRWYRAMIITYLLLLPIGFVVYVSFVTLGSVIQDIPPGFFKDAFVQNSPYGHHPERLEISRYVLLITLLPSLFYIGVNLFQGNLAERWETHWPALAQLCHRLGRWQLTGQLALLPAAFFQAGLLCVLLPHLREGNLLKTSIVSAPYTPYGLAYFATGGVTCLAGGVAYYLLQRWQRSRSNVAATANPNPQRTSLVAFWGVVLPLLLACLYTILRLLPSFSLTLDQFPDQYHIWYTYGELGAVWNGATPLVDFFPQYQFLLSYLFLPLFQVLGFDFNTFIPGMVAFSLLGLILVYQVFYLYTTSSLAEQSPPVRHGGWALLLYIPFCAVSFFPWWNPPTAFQSTFTYFSVAPSRYLGPMLVAWLGIRYFRQPNQTNLAILSCIGSGVVINNPDFGLPALVGILVAIAVTTSDGAVPRWQTLRQLGQQSLPWVLLPVLLFALLTWARSGHWPNWGAMLLFRKLFLYYGYSCIPAPDWGLPWVIYTTFMAALLLGLWRAIVSHGHLSPVQRLRAGMLIFVGIWGCGPLGYYMTRSHPFTLISVFPAWALAATLLFWEQFLEWRLSGQRFAIRDRLVRIIPSLLLLFFYLNFWGCFWLVPTPDPSKELQRIQTPGSYEQVRRSVVEYIQKRTQPGEKVLIFGVNAFDLANVAQVRNVYPYASRESLLLKSQIPVILQQMEQQGVTKAFGHFTYKKELRQAIAERYTLVDQLDPEFEFWQKNRVSLD